MKHTLQKLSFADNARIDNESIPAILLLAKLIFLSAFGTCISIIGLRRLAKVIHDEQREVDVEIPASCDEYINNMSSKYLINPRAPLITAPSACKNLSTAALKRNLAAHAEYNADIVTSGSKKEMAHRLKKILLMREADMLVREMVWGDEVE